MRGVAPATFGTLLRRFRRHAGLTQGALAEKARLSVEAISTLERGTRQTPRPDTAILLADALDLTPSERASLLAAARGFPRSTPMLAPRLPLIGREPERAALERHIAGDHRAPLLVIGGEPGIGKTRLLRETEAAAREAGYAVVVGSCGRRSAMDPYAPIPQAIQAHLAPLSAAQQRAALRGCTWLARLLPELVEAHVLPMPEWTLPPEQERRLMFAAVRTFLANVAGRGGTLLILDDLHWAGSDVLDLLTALVQTTTESTREPAGKLRVLAAFRDTDVRAGAPLAHLLADLAREEQVQRLTLHPLRRAEAEQLLDTLLAEDHLSADDLAAARQPILQRAGGIPYFLVSFAQALQSGALGDGTTADLSHIAGDVPLNVADSIRQRVAALSDIVRHMLDVAAVIGRSVSRSFLQAIAHAVGRSESELMLALSEATRARLFVPGELGSNEYVFPHDLIHDVLLADLEPTRRALLHRLIAQTMEHASPDAPAEALAYHYSQSDDQEKALIYVERAAEHAREIFANDQATFWYRELIARSEALDRPEVTTRARARLGAVQMMLGRYDEALDNLTTAAETYRHEGNLEGEARVAATIGWVHTRRGTPSEGRAYLRSLLAAVEAPHRSVVPSETLAQLYGSLAFLCFVGGDYAGQLNAAERMAELVRDGRDTTRLAQAERARGLALIKLGRLDEALVAEEATLHAAEVAGDLDSMVSALNDLAANYRQRGELRTSWSYSERALAAAERLGDPMALAYMTRSHGHNALLLGHWDDAREYFERSLRHIRTMGSSWVTPYPLALLGHLSLVQGHPNEAEPYFDDAMRVARQSGDLQAQRFAQTMRADYDLLNYRARMTLASFEQLYDRPGQREADVTVLLPLAAWAHVELGEEAEARKLLYQCLTRAKMEGSSLVEIEALRVTALLAMRQQRWQEASEALQTALRQCQQMPYPYAEAKALYFLGIIHLETQDHQQARTCLEQARTICEQLGERLYAERIEHALAKMVAHPS